MGGSEVGHLCLGAGRIVTRISPPNKLVEEGEFQRNQVLLEAMNRVVVRGAAPAWCRPAGALAPRITSTRWWRCEKQASGRFSSTPSSRQGRALSASPFIDELEARLSEIGLGRIATVSGRYYAMDRDNRWDRTKRAWDAMVHGVGATATSARAGIEASYAAGVTDEFVLPIVIVDDDGAPLATVSDGDSLIFFNFRGDRARQLTQAFNIEEFDKFDRGRRPRVHYVCMMKYLDADIPVAFSMPEPHHGLAETLALHGRTQLHAAETEKFAHVTFFFNGGRERPFTGEYRVLVPSPKVATYDLMPEMSAAGVAEEAVKCILSGHFDFAVINFANCDMVGHTGVFDAAVKAVEAVDRCVGQVWDAVRSVGGALLVTADHGNADAMVDHDTGGPSTAHSLNPVPFILAGTEARRLRDGGNFGDVAPTILELMGIQQPAAMTGASLIAG